MREGGRCRPSTRRLRGALAMGLLAMSAAGGAEPPRSCEGEIGATATAYRLSELPQSIRDDVTSRREVFGEGLADSDSPIRRTDAPSPAESEYPMARFVQAMLVRDIWFVQYEVALFSGVRTVSYRRKRDGQFDISPSHYFGGPACASIKAALAGVTTPGGF